MRPTSGGVCPAASGQAGHVTSSANGSRVDPMKTDTSFQSEIRLGHRRIAPGEPCFVIAEIGSNHNGHYEVAAELIRQSARAGADAVKFQDFSREDLFVPRLPQPITPDWSSRQALLSKRWDILPDFSADPDWWSGLAEVAREEGVAFLCSPFSLQAIERLDRIGVPAWKIASGDITWHELIARAARTNKPLILSTGASSIEEVAEALGCVRAAGCRQVVLLHCVSNYPPRWEDANLRAISVLAERFGVPVGLSDHSPGSVLPVASLAFGCCLLEKHVTLDRSQQGLDHHFAMEISEFAQLVTDLRHAEMALAGDRKHWVSAEEEERYWVRRGLWATRKIAAGEIIRREDVAVLRPAQGLPASAIEQAVGAVAMKDIEEGYPLMEGDLNTEASIGA